MSHIQHITPEEPVVSRPRRRRALLVAVFGLTLVAAGAGAVLTGLVPLPFRTAASPPAAAAAPALPVSVAAVEQRTTTLWSEFSGRVEAVGRVEVRPRVAGAIVDVRFREGSQVRKGDVLFVIDPAPFAAEVQRTEAQLATAQAQLAYAAKDQARGQQLATASFLPVRDQDQRVNALSAAQAGIRAAEAQLALARLNLGWTEVRAPIDGRVGRIEVTPGNLVPAGPTAPVLTTLVSVSPIYASFEADEQTVARALASLPKGAGIDAVPVELGTLATQGTPIRGTLQFIDNVVDARSGTVRVRAVFRNEDGALMPGQFARLHLGRPQPDSVIAVSERAVGTDQDRRFVLVVGDDNKAAYRPVQLGGLAEGLRIVTAGLKPGERIVVNGLQRVRPGAPVTPQTVPMEPAPELAAR